MQKLFNLSQHFFFQNPTDSSVLILTSSHNSQQYSMVMWAYGFCVSYRDAVNGGSMSSGTQNTGLPWGLLGGELQTHRGDLAKETQSGWQRTTKTTVVSNCDPLNCFLFDRNLQGRPSFTSTCTFFICVSRNPFYSLLMETPHSVTQMHKIPNSTKFISTC